MSKLTPVEQTAMGEFLAVMGGGYTQSDVLHAIVSLGSEGFTPNVGQILLARLEAEKNAKAFRLKVSEKGCVHLTGVPGANSQYGMTLRIEGWECLKVHSAEIDQFIADNREELERRSEAARAAKAADKAAPVAS